MAKKRIGGLIIKNNKFLLVSGLGSDYYWTPGGKSEPGETEEETLKREIKEELNVELKSSYFLYSYISVNKMNGEEMEIFYYVIDIKGKITPSNEIDKTIWISKEDIERKDIKFSYGVKKITQILINKNLI